jgi:hypothetical protein
MESGVEFTTPRIQAGTSPLVPFLLGTAVGGVAGAVVGTLLGGHAAHFFAALIEMVERRDTGERSRPRFELLLQ